MTSNGRPVDAVPTEEVKSSEPIRLVAQLEKPLEMDCQLRLPLDMMHSFQGRHNAIVWKIIVEGEVKKWPSFYRSFPVVVFPPDAA